MEEKQLKELQDLIKNEVKSLNEAYKAFEKTSNDEKAVLAGKIEKLDENIIKLSKQADALELQVKQNNLPKERKSVFDEIKKAITDPKTRSEIKAGRQMTFELKASTIDEATELSNSSLATSVIVPFREQGVGKAPDRPTTLLSLVNMGIANSNRVTWVERTARTAAAAAVAEAGQFPQSDFTWIQRAQPVEKIGTFVKITNEALEDWDQVEAEIRNELIPMVERALEAQVYAGNNTPPNLNGITTNAAGFDVAALAGKVPNANYLDAIRAAVAQLLAANFAGPFSVFINPVDMALLDLEKSAEGAYLIPPFVTADRKLIAGAQVFQSTLVSAGNVLVGDFSRDTLFIRRGIELKIWDQDSTDPEYDLKTITASVRAANRIKQPDYNAFVYDSFSDIIDSIKKAQA